MDNKTTTRTITSLLDLVNEKPKTILMQVSYDNEKIEFEIQSLSSYEWMALDHVIPYPERIQSGVTAQGPKYDVSHPEYQLALRQRTTLIQLKRIARCIQADIPGETNDEQAKWLGDHFEIGILSAISNQLNDLHNEGDAMIVHHSQAFPAIDSAKTSDNGKTPTHS